MAWWNLWSKPDPRTDAAEPASTAPVRPFDTLLEARADGWMNYVTGLGDPSQDKRKAATFTAKRMEYQECVELYRGNDMAARIIEAPADEMLREGFDVCIEGDKQAMEATTARLDELEVNAELLQALYWKRAYGGAGILLGANDGAKHPSEPLNLDTIRTFNWLSVFDSQELVPATFYTDPASPKYGQPELYWIQPAVGNTNEFITSTTLVHETRIVRFAGVRVNRTQERERRGWGDSVLVRVDEVLADFGASWDGAAHLMNDFAQSVFKMHGIREAVAADREKQILKRLQLMNMSRSIVRAAVLDADAGEDFKREATPVSGLPELLDKFCLRLAAAAKMPVSLLMGQAPAGLNATGDSDIRWFYDQVAGAQHKDLRPQINRILKVLFCAKNGPTGGKEPDNWSIKFRPLWQLTAVEQATLRKTQAETDQIYISAQVVTPEEIAVSRFSGDGYSTDTTLDTETREAMAQEDPPAEPGSEDEQPARGEEPPAKDEAER